MRARLLVAAGLSLTALGSAGAQTTCPAGTPTQQTAAEDARQQASDVFQYVAPQLGLVIAGGSPTLGQAGSLGGLGHFSIGLRGNALAGTLPKVDQFQQCYDGAKSRTLPTEDHAVGLPGIDAAVGVFKGLPLGLTNVGGVDLLFSASYVPEIQTSN